MKTLAGYDDIKQTVDKLGKVFSHAYKSNIGICLTIKDSKVASVRTGIQTLGWTHTKLFPHWNTNLSDFEYYVKDQTVAIIDANASTLSFCALATLYKDLP